MRNRILTLMQASAIFMFLTKLPMTTVLVVILSLATIFYKLLQNKLYFDKLNNKTIVVIIAMLLYMLCRIMSQYVVGIDLYDVDIDYIVTISLAFILFVSILFHRDAYAILYAIIASSLFTGGWAIFELIFNFNTLSSRFSDPGNIFYISGNRVPTAFYYNENDMLYFLVLFLPITFFFFRRRLVSLVYFLMVLTLALYIASKAAVITLLIYVMWYFIFGVKNISDILKRIVLSILFVSIGVLILYLFGKDALDLQIIDKVVYRFSGLVDFINGNGGDSSSLERFSIYLAVASFIYSNISMLFVGFGNFSYYEGIILNHYPLRIADFHNMHFEIITLFGLPFYILLGCVFFYMYKMNKNISFNNTKVFKLMMLTFLTFLAILSSSVLKYPSFYVFIMLLAVLCENKSRVNEY
ncbi:TPA: O83 family O-antigen polymerase [Escherichia coli]|uniref:O83 family O-antigen polymerase n=1 Tax=Escherichia coli TaxID=562 RepID=UPI0023B013A4|nr:O83 family O-antigen polymerase [Escherichia coli]MDE7845939.1 O83 family O-antigen polymerase [Escherichia coli]HCQ0129389.1 O83 family O-antigen polymerase [Escherichia coli]